MQLVLQRAEINEREITLEVFAFTEAPLRAKVGAVGDVVRVTPDWHPTLVYQRTIRFSFKCHLPSLIQLRHQETSHRIALGGDNVVTEWRDLLDEGIVKKSG